MGHALTIKKTEKAFGLKCFIHTVCTMIAKSHPSEARQLLWRDTFSIYKLSQQEYYKKYFIKIQEPKNSSLVQQYPSMPPTLFRYIGLKPYLSTYLFELLYKTSHNTSQTFFSEDTVSKTKTFQKSQVTLFKKTEMSRKIRPQLEEDNVTYREKNLVKTFARKRDSAKIVHFIRLQKMSLFVKSNGRMIYPVC